MLLTTRFTFDAAHFLTQYYGKCERLHGHTYWLEVTVEGEPASNGLLIDFIVLKRIVTTQILDKLDHSNLNDLFSNPTTELIAIWIWDQLYDLKKLLKNANQDPQLKIALKNYLTGKPHFKITSPPNINLHEIKLGETKNNFITYKGPFKNP
ncbi:MAG: 6-pyruvoyl tetrahydropterin synthase, 6-pyruvoyl tetrahydrobiopterin synthase [Candidatus Peregrinibacteria bacterium GW2011_GWE2_39_6]|nr:MAG: 6-pyruvoyl tetrahydropterin synthase, 6-pyruvoyl tetrahydrobiopterin synthase [Candidatus Peregrinibacteria bacterium GW2011_GWF2_39_17]KKR26597.1 MAG: 6-pyruvoyl tetrahydropterin synthase, 6-pyruvoyl tetrahydrobiopterin synthase [Candidatus Peregrinibacteria bacterium GW2011_GWE2_39_6]HCW32499.1 6-carboxytetrahydropterin synthase QueD [Candidatus Peregrinibacteria bacterium]